jgi:3-hydroxybutyryl-CoA dehydrogenase
MKVQIIADQEYQSGFEQAFGAFDVITAGGDVIIDARFLDPTSKLASPVNASLIVTNTLTHSASAYGSQNVIGIPMLPNYFANQSTIEYSTAQGVASIDVEEFFVMLAKKGEQINDCVAGVFPRALAMIINEAAFALQESVASAEDIDQAMKLGTNYPKGPLAWCDEIGAEAIVATLDALAKEYGGDRYRVASRLRRNAEAGVLFYNTQVLA